MTAIVPDKMHDSMSVVELLRSTDWRRTGEELAAALAILLAFVHARHLRQQIDRLEEVRRALPTQHLGKFPDYMQRIVDVVRQARKSVIILCDFPAYGALSNPEAFREYRHALEERSDGGVTIEVACLNDDLRAAATDAEFPKTEQWPEWRQKETNLDHLQKLLARHGKRAKAETVTREQVIELLCAEDKRTLDETFGGAHRCQVKNAVPLYLWLVDGSQAVFAIPSFNHRSVEHGFYTMDPRLIEGLLDIRARYLADATCDVD